MIEKMRDLLPWLLGIVVDEVLRRPGSVKWETNG